jgi:hypothetical protein
MMKCDFEQFGNLLTSCVLSDHRRWRRGGPSIPTTGATKIDYSKGILILNIKI